MPHISLPGGISLYYEVHHAGSTGGSSSSSPALSERPTVLLLSPSWLDASFLSSMIETLRDYNVVVMELRSHGRTRGAVSPNYDHFVGAADIGELQWTRL